MARINPNRAPRWSGNLHWCGNTVYLSESSPRTHTVPGFVGQLWDPQASMLAALMEWENMHAIRLKSDLPSILRSNAIRIAAEFSFGKTVLCLALVGASPVPRAFPITATRMLMCKANTVDAKSDKHGYRMTTDGSFMVYPEISQYYSRLYPATLVIAEASVISQWAACARQFTPDKKVFIIDDVKSMRTFAGMFDLGDANDINVVLLKAGKISSKFRVGLEELSDVKTRSTTEALAAVTAGFSWARVIVDDFDTIRFTSSDVLPPALSHIIVSATDRTSSIKKPLLRGETVEEFLRLNMTTPALGFSHDFLYDGSLKLICQPEYVKKHINTMAASFRRIVVKGGYAAAMLKDLGLPPDIVEMVAAGAVETAAEKLNIKADSIGDLLKRVLDKQTREYRGAVKILARIDSARLAMLNSVRAKSTDVDAKKVRKALKNGTDAQADSAVENIGQATAYLKQKLKTLEEYAKKICTETGGRLQRMRENIRENQCQACMVEIDDESYVVNCCQIIVCGFCIVTQGKPPRYISRCPNCARDVHAKQDLIYVGKDLKLEKALDDKMLLAAAEKPEVPDWTM